MPAGRPCDTPHLSLADCEKQETGTLGRADSDSRRTKHLPEEWFTPRPDLVANELKTAGFRNSESETIRSNLAAKGKAARQILPDFGVKLGFRMAHRDFLAAGGLELPYWIIAPGKKVGSPETGMDSNLCGFKPLRPHSSSRAVK